MDLAQGHLCYVEYQGYPGVVHARLVIEQVSGTEWVIATPDNDVYVEDLQPQNPDFSQFFHVPNGGLPPGVPRAHIYSFQPLSAQQYSGMLAEGRREAQDERLRRGIPAASSAPLGR